MMVFAYVLNHNIPYHISDDVFINRRHEIHERSPSGGSNPDRDRRKTTYCRLYYKGNHVPKVKNIEYIFGDSGCV